MVGAPNESWGPTLSISGAVEHFRPPRRKDTLESSEGLGLWATSRPLRPQTLSGAVLTSLGASGELAGAPDELPHPKKLPKTVLLSSLLENVTIDFWHLLSPPTTSAQGWPRILSGFRSQDSFLALPPKGSLTCTAVAFFRHRQGAPFAIITAEKTENIIWIRDDSSFSQVLVLILLQYLSQLTAPPYWNHPYPNWDFNWWKIVDLPDLPSTLLTSNGDKREIKQNWELVHHGLRKIRVFSPETYKYIGGSPRCLPLQLHWDTLVNYLTDCAWQVHMKIPRY